MTECSGKLIKCVVTDPPKIFILTARLKRDNSIITAASKAREQTYTTTEPTAATPTSH